MIRGRTSLRRKSASRCTKARCQLQSSSIKMPNSAMPSSLFHIVHVIGDITGALGFHGSRLYAHFKVVCNMQHWHVMQGAEEGYTQVDEAAVSPNPRAQASTILPIRTLQACQHAIRSHPPINVDLEHLTEYIISTVTLSTILLHARVSSATYEIRVRGLPCGHQPPDIINLATKHRVHLDLAPKRWSRSRLRNNF